jgi:hypothetical protein
MFLFDLQVIRDREFTRSELSQNQLPGITVVDKGADTIWADRETGCSIDSGEDGFHFTVTKNGQLILTAYLKFGMDESEFVLNAK